MWIRRALCPPLEGRLLGLAPALDYRRSRLGHCRRFDLAWVYPFDESVKYMGIRDENTFLLGVEALMKAGRGMCSQSTYDAIASALHATQRVLDTPLTTASSFAGIELFVNPFVPDGVIWPWPTMDLEFPSIKNHEVSLDTQ